MGADILNHDGFISGESLMSEMAKNGFLDHQVHHAMRRLASRRLIETPHAHYREVKVDEKENPEQFYYRATSTGIYHLRFWTGAFAFLDATSTDTPIFDQAVREEVCNLAASFDIKDRYRRACAFRDYLEAQWNAANIGATYYDFLALIAQERDGFVVVRNVVERGDRGGVGRRR
jgi:hypothetical protein